MRISDEQWQLIESDIPAGKKSRRGGRPELDRRKVLDGILWVLLSGKAWTSMPRRYGSGTTAWRLYRRWVADGTWERVWKGLVVKLHPKQKVEWSRALERGRLLPLRLEQ